jgi:hypothetical protein
MINKMYVSVFAKMYIQLRYIFKLKTYENKLNFPTHNQKQSPGNTMQYEPKIHNNVLLTEI